MKFICKNCHHSQDEHSCAGVPNPQDYPNSSCYATINEGQDDEDICPCRHFEADI